jgi:uncharacterized protein (DUF58 family)
MSVGPGRRSIRLSPTSLHLLLLLIVLRVLWGQDGTRVVLAGIFGVAGALLVNAVWARMALRNARVEVMGCPTDATVGDEVPVTLAITGVRGPVEVRVRSSQSAPWYQVAPPATGEVAAPATFRGVVTVALVEVASMAPLGLLGAGRLYAVPLPHTLSVGPRPVRPTRLPPLGGRPRLGEEESVRGTRPYVSGDPLRHIHWPSVARSGSLTVRDFDHPPRGRLSVVVDLGTEGGGRNAEDAAGRAAGIAIEALGQGLEVRLHTVVDGVHTTEVVRSAVAVSRALAAAGPGRPPGPATGEPGTTVVVSPSGELWR